jgi:hypothetical protein
LLLACLDSQSLVDFWSFQWWPDVQIRRFFHSGRNEGCILLLGRRVEVSYSFLNTLGHFCDGGGMERKLMEHALCRFHSYLSPALPIRKKTAPKCASKRQRRYVMHAHAWIRAQLRERPRPWPWRQSAVPPNTPALTSFLHFQQLLPTKQHPLSSSGCCMRGLACARVLLRSFVVVFCVVT